MFAVLLVNLMASLFFYVNGFKYGLSARKWISIGAVAGVAALPLFLAEKRFKKLATLSKGTQKIFLF